MSFRLHSIIPARADNKPIAGIVRIIGTYVPGLSVAGPTGPTGHSGGGSGGGSGTVDFLNVTNDLSVGGNTSLHYLDVIGNCLITGGCEIDGDIVCGGNVSCVNMTCGNFQAIGHSNFGSDVLFSNSINIQGNCNVTGNFTATTKNFVIDHPDPEKKGWKLKHSCVETPSSGDNIYRYSVTSDGGKGEITLPPYFEHLNEKIQIWVSPIEHFGVGYGKYSDNKVSLYTKGDGDYNILIIGTRKDSIAVEHWNKTSVEYK